MMIVQLAAARVGSDSAPGSFPESRSLGLFGAPPSLWIWHYSGSHKSVFGNGDDWIGCGGMKR